MRHAPDARRGARAEAAHATEIMPNRGVDVDVQHVVDTAGRLDTDVPTDTEGFEQGAVEEGHSGAPGTLRAAVGRVRQRHASRRCERTAQDGHRWAVFRRRGLQAATNPDVNPVDPACRLRHQLTGQPQPHLVLTELETAKATEREQVAPEAALAGNRMNGDAAQDQVGAGRGPCSQRDPRSLPAVDRNLGPFPEPEAAPDLARHDLHPSLLLACIPGGRGQEERYILHCHAFCNAYVAMLPRYTENRLSSPTMNDYTANFVAAMEATGTRNRMLVAALNNRISSSDISSWRAGRRPIPAEHAPVIATVLGIAPEHISEAYERLLLAGLPAQTTDSQQAHSLVSGHLTIQRLEGFGYFGGPPRLVIPELIVRPRIGTTTLSALRWTLQPSVALDPEIRQGTPVFIDTSIRRHEQVVDRGIYAYMLWGRPDIRRIMVRRDSWALSCVNKEADATVLPEAELEQMSILGAVVGWINPP